MKIRALMLASFGLMWLVAPVHADQIDLDNMACSDDARFISTSDVTGNTGGSDACFGAFDGNDPGPSGTIETGGMVFSFISKVDIGDNGNPSTVEGANIGLNVYQPGLDDSCAPDDDATMTGAASTGCWSYDPSLFSADAFIIVIKAANSPGWAAYLFDTHSDSSWGEWLVAWGDVKNGIVSYCLGADATVNCKDISHLSIYANGGVLVSEPGTLALLGLGLIALGIARRRRVTA